MPMENLEVMSLETWKIEFTDEECNFDKLQEYLNLINECIERYDPDRYSEKHHIMPKCIDKEKKYQKQVIQLNGADHFLVHKKLVECFNGTLKSKMCFALTKLLGHVKPYISPEDYEYARQISAEASKGNQNAKGQVHSEETRQRRSNSLMGHKINKKTRKKISESLKKYYAKNREKYGKSFSDETCKKLRNSLLEYNKVHKNTKN